MRDMGEKNRKNLSRIPGASSMAMLKLPFKKRWDYLKFAFKRTFLLY